jgi:predicted nuclease of restriction endonuclease-like RecB superfamily
MLTADLAMSWRRGDQIRPRQIRADDARYTRVAADLISIFAAHEGRARRELEDALRDYVGTGTDYRVLRGLIKLLTDRCRFDTAVKLDPVEVRRALFLKARERHPLTAEAARLEVAAEAARELACDAEAALAAVYADLPGEQSLLEFEQPDAGELLDLYNLAQAQALLYRSVEMRLWVEPQAAAGYRELFGAIKAHRLIHTIRGDAARGYEIRLDGPVSMFHRSQKYGVQMAVFLPSLLACAGWRMRAEINARPGGSAYFELDSRQNTLRTPLAGALRGYENPAVEKLSESWGRAGVEWSLEPNAEVVAAGETALVPDFRVIHPAGRVFYLEILGFWTPEHLRARVAELDRSRLRNYVLAAWEDLRGTREPLAHVPPNVIVFKKNLDPAIVELTINKLAAEGA